jgi:PP-loop superfamily ATP-utilizing enzyme
MAQSRSSVLNANDGILNQNNVKQFISFSGGVESSTMCVLFGNKADAIFADTGYEHQEIYDRLDLVEKWVQDFHRKDFKIHRIKNENYISLKSYIIQSKFYPSFKSRYCTRMFKIEPIDDFLEQFKEDGIELMIGLNADEIEMRTGNHGNKAFVKYSYPLADKGITRDGCKVILNRAGLLPQFPVYMQRGGCVGCYYKSKKEYEAMALLNPEEFKQVEQVEENIQDRREDFFSIIPGIKMSQIRQNVSNMIFKPEEIYPAINDATKCGVFCNR